MEKSELQQKIEEKGIIISRVPEWARDIFKEKANTECCGDYGWCLSELIKDSMEYDRLKTMFLNNQLDIQVGIKDKEELKNHIPDKATRTIKFANGKTIEIQGGAKNE
jgi:hypothetical protein